MGRMNEATRSGLMPGCSSRLRAGISSLDRVIEDRVMRLQASHIAVNPLNIHHSAVRNEGREVTS